MEEPSLLSMPPLEIHNLKAHFYTDEGIVKAVDRIDLCIPAGMCLDWWANPAAERPWWDEPSCA